MKPPATASICLVKLVSALAAIIVLPLGLFGCGKHLPPSHSTEIASKGLYTASVNVNGELVVAGSIHHGGSLWRLADNERLFNWNHQSDAFSSVTAAAFDNTGKHALTADTNTLVLWDTQSGSALRYWQAPADILAIALSTHGKYALLGMSDNTAVIFDAVEGGIKRKFHHHKPVISVDLSADGHLALSGSSDQTAILWDVKSGEKLSTFRHADEVPLVKLSGDGSLALTVGKYDKATLWQTASGEQVAEVPLKAQHIKRGIRFTSAVFSADNQFLLTGRQDQIVTLWQIENLRAKQHWKLPKRRAWKPVNATVLALAFQQQRHSFVAISSDGFIHYLTDNSRQ